MSTFTASYAGTCEACGNRFGAGAEIVRTGTGYAHASQCPGTPFEQVRPACPSCFLELPVSGVCGECS